MTASECRCLCARSEGRAAPHKHFGIAIDTCSFCSSCPISSMSGRRFLSLADHAAGQGEIDSAARDDVSLAELTERWRTWQLSNLDYLLQLNRLAGRHAGDRAFAPLLPWVLDLSIPPEPDMDTLTVKRHCKAALHTVEAALHTTWAAMVLQAV
jgi:hypothetical protein